MLIADTIRGSASVNLAGFFDKQSSPMSPPTPTQISAGVTGSNLGSATFTVSAAACKRLLRWAAGSYTDGADVQGNTGSQAYTISDVVAILKGYGLLKE